MFTKSSGMCDHEMHASSGSSIHKVMLNHYQQIKNLLVSYSENKLGFF